MMTATLALVLSLAFARTTTAAPIIGLERARALRADVCHGAEGVCFTGQPLFGSSNITATSAEQCCLQCRKFSFRTPQTPTPCVNFTFNATDKQCNLYPANQPKVNATECTSGSPPAFNVSVPCSTDLDCNTQGTCAGGSNPDRKCTCRDGFTGDYCEQGPPTAGNCSLVADVCLSGSLVSSGWATPATGPSKNVSSLSECCKLCNLVDGCNNFTYFDTKYVTPPTAWQTGPWAGYCALYTNVGTPKESTKDTPCVSGGSNGHFVPPCSADADCNAEGTCATPGGSCTCKDDFTGPLCQTSPTNMGSCVLHTGLRMTGTPIFSPSANNGQAPPLTTPTPQDCCYECTKHAQDTPNPCRNFTYNSTSKECNLYPSVGPLSWDDAFVSGGPLPAPPSEDHTLKNLQVGVCLSGALLIDVATPTLEKCAGVCSTYLECKNFTYKIDGSNDCSLQKSGATVTKDPTCISGAVQPSGGALPCRDSAGKLDCSGAGSCKDGTCACDDGFSGGSCGMVPEKEGSCDVQAGLCLDSSSPLPPPFGVRNATSIADCCYLCDQTIPPNLCQNFTFNTTTKICKLLPSQPSLQSYDKQCISGGAGGHYPNLECRNAADCNNQGTCTNGACKCNADFTGPMCEFVKPVDGNCTIQTGVCIPGTNLFDNAIAAKTVEDCCFECTRFQLCTSWTFNSSGNTCELHSSTSGQPLLNDDCTSGGPPARSSPTCDMSHIKAGSCLTGSPIGTPSAKTLSDCCGECGNLLLCSQWNFETSTETCTLYGANATVDPNASSCVSGATGGGFLPCRESEGKLDCNNQGTCTAGTCTCTGGYTGGACESAPESMGGCTIEEGLAYTSPEIFGSGPGTSAADCCYLCNQHSGPASTIPCTNYTFNKTAQYCTLHNSPTVTQRSVQPDCTAGYAHGHKDLKCRDGNKADCNNQGTCTDGSCHCTGGYSGDFCEFVPKEKCKINFGKCITGEQIGGAGADDVGQCCHECTHYPGCGNFTYNSSSGICTLHSNCHTGSCTTTVSPHCTSGEITPNLPPPPPSPPAPPPPPAPPKQMYKCDEGGDCVEAADGTYDKADCDGKCTAPPPAPADDASLKSLVLSTGDLVPAFDTTTKTYTCTEPSGTKTITVTAETTDATATMTINGVESSSGKPSADIPLSDSAATKVTIGVTAADGTTKETYTIDVSVSPG